MDIIVYYLICLLARKKLIAHVSYCIGTVVFVSLSYNTANQLYKTPNTNRWSLMGSSMNNSQMLNNSFHHEERVKFLKDQCQNTKHPNSRALYSLIHHSNSLNHLGFLLRSQSVFYCSVPKVATRTLLTYITYLHVRDELMMELSSRSKSYFNPDRKLFDVDYLNKMLSSPIRYDKLPLLSMFLSRLITPGKSNSSDLDLWTMYQKNGLPHTRLLTMPDFSSLFSNNFTRVIFVRHPLERLASAYEDKIASLTAAPLSAYDTLRREICQKYSSSYLTPEQREKYNSDQSPIRIIDEPCQKIIPSFEHFVDHIMSESAQVDVHWQPYSILCHTCTFKYNFIGKYETIQEDLNTFRTKLGLNSAEWDVKNSFSTGKTKEHYISLYAKLPKDLICNLKDFYQQDFKLFNYQFEDYFTNQQNISCPQKYYRRFRVY